MSLESDYSTKAEVDRVVYDPEIYDRISDDNSPPLEAFQMVYLGTMITGYVNGEVASLFHVVSGKLHYMVLKPYRRHARALLRQAFELYPHPVWCSIPALYMEVINFALNFGFRRFAIEEKGHKKNGEFYDCHLLEYDPWA